MQTALEAAAPPPELTLSEWADTYRVLSREASAEPGAWDTSRAEYQREIMDTISDPAYETVVLMTSSQVGKSEIINNYLAYSVHLDPCPILFVHPSDKHAEEYSRIRIAPLVRDTPVLTERVSDAKSRYGGNTTLYKEFPGGHLTLAGANVPAGLASKPICKLLCDEVDRFPISAGSEGDPIKLAEKRTTTFWNRKKVYASTPGIKDHSRIEKAYEESDQRHYYVPCPHCDEFQILRWKIKEGDEDRHLVVWESGKPETAVIICIHCGVGIDEGQRRIIISKGEWRKHNPESKIAGFHLNELYSPWKRLSEVVDDFIKAKNDPEQLKVWVNTSLGETWEDRGESVSESALMERRETYLADVPMKAMVLTCGVDVQKDRLELEVKGWGEGEESWGISYKILWGDPGERYVWDTLLDELKRTFQHESGHKLRISATCIDSGGLHTSVVYHWCKGREKQRIFAIKGVSGDSKPIISAAMNKQSGTDRRKVKLFMVGVDVCKETLFARLKKKEPGPGYFHFPKHYDKDYFDGLTAEEVLTKYKNGHPIRVWLKKKARNEPIDINNYAYAAFKLLSPNWEALTHRFKCPAMEDVPQAPPPERKKRRVIGKMNGF